MNQKLSVADALKKAIMSEGDGYHFYMMASQNSKDAKGKKIFEQLAHEELEHIRFLRHQYKSVLESGKTDPSVTLGSPLEFTDESPIFSGQIKERLRESHYEMASLSVAVQLELDASKYYKEQTDAADDEHIKAFFAELADWENGHYQALLKQLEELKEDYWTQNDFSPF